MVKTKISLILLASLTLAGCVSGPEKGQMTWKKHSMDGHRTGVVASTAANVSEAMGVISDGIYTSPNQKTFPEGSATYAAALDVIAVQPQMAELKTVIAHSAHEMKRRGANCELSNWIIDHLSEEVARITGRKVDVGIINSGGIRVDMPEGEVFRDDIASMLPFRNYLCYVKLRGSDLKILFENMAKRSIQPVSGVKVVVNDRQLDTLLVGGQPVDPSKTYGVATIDFLLDGGDKLNVGKNALELIQTDVKVMDVMIPYAQSYEAAGKQIEYFTDDRVVIKGRRERR